MSKPFTSYNGGKHGNGTYQNIINWIPKHDIFIEPMVGNGGIFHNLKLPKLSIINDIDPSVIVKYNCKPGLIVKNDCYSSIIKEYDDILRNIFIYFDPPYLFSTRSSKQKYYKHDWTDDDHYKFLSMVVIVKSNCMISHYPCKTYDDALKGWQTFDFESITRNGLRTERIYMNYPTPNILQDFRYLGKDFIERQQIKRKTERLLNKLESLPELERVALLSAVIGKYNYTSVKILAEA
jgi:DNA adenine methylase